MPGPSNKILPLFPAGSSELEIWKRLYERAFAFHKLAPWQWMVNDDIFGIVDPATNKTNYCLVMGAGREMYGLAVYPGEEGLLSLRRILDLPVQEDAMFRQKALLVSFELPKHLEQVDKQQLRAHGYSIQARKRYPVFRDYAPGWEAWPIDSKQAEMLITMLEQAMYVAETCRENEEYLMPGNGDEVPIRSSVINRGVRVWVDSAKDPVLEASGEEDHGNFSLARVKDKANGLRKVRTAWELRLSYAPFFLKEAPKDRAHFPVLLLAVDAQSGMVVGFHLFEKEPEYDEAADALISIFRKVGVMPGILWMKAGLGWEILKPIADALEIELNECEELPGVDEAMNAFFADTAPGRKRGT